jgi:hypothetical protein
MRSVEFLSPSLLGLYAALARGQDTATFAANETAVSNEACVRQCYTGKPLVALHELTIY